MLAVAALGLLAVNQVPLAFHVINLLAGVGLLIKSAILRRILQKATSSAGLGK